MDKVGKMEYDGDPLEAHVHGGVQEARKGFKRFPSEFADGGLVSWKAHGSQRSYWLDVSFPNIEWNKHVQLTNSLPILEWQSWAVLDFLVTENSTVRMACMGVHSFSLDAVGHPWFAGDIYRSGTLWLLSPVLLRLVPCCCWWWCCSMCVCVCVCMRACACMLMCRVHVRVRANDMTCIHAGRRWRLQLEYTPFMQKSRPKFPRKSAARLSPCWCHQQVTMLLSHRLCR